MGELPSVPYSVNVPTKSDTKICIYCYFLFFFFFGNETYRWQLLLSACISGFMTLALHKSLLFQCIKVWVMNVFNVNFLTGASSVGQRYPGCVGAFMRRHILHKQQIHIFIFLWATKSQKRSCNGFAGQVCMVWLWTSQVSSNCDWSKCLFPNLKVQPAFKCTYEILTGICGHDWFYLWLWFTQRQIMCSERTTGFTTE